MMPILVNSHFQQLCRLVLLLLNFHYSPYSINLDLPRMPKLMGDEMRSLTGKII